MVAKGLIEIFEANGYKIIYTREPSGNMIEPALQAKRIVICDRFVDSSIAYQGYGRNIGPELVECINDFPIAGKRPDLTFLIDVKPEVGLARINKDKNREVNQLDLEEIDFHLMANVK